jgi:hypothetical protein
VSLRSEIHAAIDDLSPSMAAMPERVVNTVLAEGPARRRRERMFFRLRAPLSLVAAVVAIALVAAVLAGGRLIQDWNESHSGAPAGTSSQSVLAELESRPMHLPILHSILDCKRGPENSEGSLGAGPIFADRGPTSSTTRGTYFHNLAYANSNVAGPVLIRARDLFTNTPVVFVGRYAAGPVVGSEVVDGNLLLQHTEVVIDTTRSGGISPYWNQSTAAHHLFDWPFTAGVPKNSPASTGWQIDGPGFSEVFLAC